MIVKIGRAAGVASITEETLNMKMVFLWNDLQLVNVCMKISPMPDEWNNACSSIQRESQEEYMERLFVKCPRKILGQNFV